MYKKLFNIGVVAYLVLVIIAIVLAKERIIANDPAFNLFEVARGRLSITHFRFGDGIAQLIPWVARRMNVSLDALMRAYSVSLILVYFACYVACGLMKQYRYALLVLLQNVLFATYSFYWPVSQVPQGTAIWIVVLAVLARNNYKMGAGSLAFIGCAVITLAFFHPLMALLVVYTSLFFYLRKHEDIRTRCIVITAAVFFGIVVIKQLAFRAQYEQHAMSGLKNFATLFPNYVNVFSNRLFLLNCLTYYYWIPVVLALVVHHYYTARKLRLLVMIALAFTGYLAVVNISYPTNETPQFYRENLHLPLGFILTLPFVIDILPRWKREGAVAFLLSAIIITGCLRIYTAHTIFTSRLSYQRKLLSQYGDRKWILDSRRIDKDTLQMTWGAPYEFWLLSTVEQGRTASIIIDDHPRDRGWAADKHKELVVNWNIFPYKDLPAPYFVFTDTVNGYTIDQ